MSENAKIIRTANLMEIDGEKLKHEFDKRGLKRSAVSVELGYSRNFVDHLVRSGAIRPIAMDALTRMYDISYDDIKPDEPVIVEEEESTVEEPQEEQNAMTLTGDAAFFDTLRLSMYAAARKGTEDALSGLGELIRKAVCDGVKDALNS